MGKRNKREGGVWVCVCGGGGGTGLRLTINLVILHTPLRIPGFAMSTYGNPYSIFFI